MRKRTWLTTTDPEPMLRFLSGRTTPRKARLLVCAAARLSWEDFPDERSRKAVRVAELHADGRADEAAVIAAWGGAIEAGLEVYGRSDPEEPLHCFQPVFCLLNNPDAMWGLSRQSLHNPVWSRALLNVLWRFEANGVSPRWPSPEVWCDLIRDIFGNPFGPVAFNPRWRTSDAVGLATAIYEDRAFDRLLLLADALMDAGCDNESLLEHLRGPGPHCRGCHVVDLVLRKD